MNEPTIRPDRLARLRKIVLALPDTIEKEAWGDPTWRIDGGKMFAGQKGNVRGHRPALWVAAPPGAQSFLVESEPERFFVPPYVGPQGWVGTWLDGARLDWAMIAELLEGGHAFIAAASRRKKAKK